jgi:hypothetical protein
MRAFFDILIKLYVVQSASFIFLFFEIIMQKEKKKCRKMTENCFHLYQQIINCLLVEYTLTHARISELESALLYGSYKRRMKFCIICE